jgi:ParB-like chromosome segregation protein Spo0J
MAGKNSTRPRGASDDSLERKPAPALAAPDHIVEPDAGPGAAPDPALIGNPAAEPDSEAMGNPVDAAEPAGDVEVSTPSVDGPPPKRRRGQKKATGKAGKSSGELGAGEPASGATKAVPEWAVIPVAQMRPNAFNPNEFTDEQRAQLVAETRRLGYPPGHIVLRGVEEGAYEVVDGAHNLEAAIACGLTEVRCEIVEADDVEARVQTFKRNQHGSLNPLKLARMFREMQAARGWSNRQLAKALDVSESTVRNHHRYLEAFDLRNSCAPERAERDVAALTVRQVERYLELPEGTRDEWVDDGASLETAGESVRAKEMAADGDTSVASHEPLGAEPEPGKPVTSAARSAEPSRQGGSATIRPGRARAVAASPEEASEPQADGAAEQGSDALADEVVEAGPAALSDEGEELLDALTDAWRRAGRAVQDRFLGWLMAQPDVTGIVRRLLKGAQ